MREKDGLNMNINVQELEDVCCEKCKNPTFRQVVLLKRVPAVMSPNGKKNFLPMPVFECSNCGHVNDELLPKIKPDDDKGMKIVQ
jgi:uncharacterized Zn finger protein|tara:strand:- start:447 stop:701 length:255 start_codon:yes stop_codon:yes gene_type:complete